MEKYGNLSYFVSQAATFLRRQKILLSVVSATLGIVALLPYNLYLFGFIFLVPFFYFLHQEKSFWKILLGTFIFRLFFALGTVYYTFEPLTWTVSMSIFLGLSVAVFLLKKILKFRHGVDLIFISIVYLAFDLLQARYSYLPTYIITAGNILGESPLVGLAKYGGLLTLGFLIVSVNAFLLWIIMYWRIVLERRKNAIILLLGFAVLFSLLCFFSKNALKKNSEAVQSNGNELKVTTVSLEKNFSPKTLSELMMQLKNLDSDLIVLPEEMIVNINNASFLPAQASQMIREYGFKADHIAATFHIVRDGKKHNEMLIFDNNGNILDQYDKNRLTIMGEYWPYSWHPSFYDFLKNDPVMKNYAIFNRNNEYVPGKTKLLKILDKKSKEIKFGPLICLEGHYADMIRKHEDDGAKFIVSPSSNRWINVGDKQYDHLVRNLYKIESIQYGLPIVVSAVNGFAGAIYPNGKAQVGSWESDLGYTVLNVMIRY